MPVPARTVAVAPTLTLAFAFAFVTDRGHAIVQGKKGPSRYKPLEWVWQMENNTPGESTQLHDDGEFRCMCGRGGGLVRLHGAHGCACAHACVRVCVCVCVRAFVRACERACVCACVRACVRARWRRDLRVLYVS